VQYKLRRVMLEGGHRRNREHLASTGGASYNYLMCKASISHSHQRNPGHWATTYVESAIDKAFLIAKPMRKADWTRRLAARWGEQHAQMALMDQPKGR
jgi:hypothetical protein